MFNLFYPDVNGNLVTQGSFASLALALAQVAADSAPNYTIQQVDGSNNIVMVMSA